MGVDVRIPLSIRVPAAPTDADMRALEQSVGRAMGRAFAVSHREVVLPRGVERPVVINPPRFRFTGAAVNDDLRREIESVARSAVDQALAGSPLVQGTAPVTSSPTVRGISEPPAEPIDHGRFDEAEMLYRVPFFHHGGDDEDNTEPVPVVDESTDLPAEQRTSESNVAGEAESNAPALLTWKRAMYLAAQFHLAENGSMRIRQDMRYGIYSVVQTPNGVGPVVVYLTAQRRNPGTGSYTLQFGIQGLVIQTFNRDEPNETFERSGDEALNRNSGIVTLINLGAPVSVDNYLELLWRHPAPSLARWIEESSEADARRRVREYLAGELQSSIASSLYLWEMRRGGRVIPSRLPNHPFNIRFRVVEYDADADGEGGGGGGLDEDEARVGIGGNTLIVGSPGAVGGTGIGGAGAAGGDPTSTSTGRQPGERSAWPRTGLGGEPLVCEPFRGEPLISEIEFMGEPWASDAQDIQQRITEIARFLELPECGFAAKFCINVASVIGGKAFEVGMAAAANPAYTTVRYRPSADGNLGVLDIVPAQTAGLQYMRDLGHGVKLLDQLQRRVVNLYRNLGLPETEERPAWTYWLRSFFDTYTECIIDSCAWVFMETSRIIMLQQLRSTKRSIEDRFSRFEEVKHAFEIALDEVGRGIVEFRILDDALRIARLAEANPPAYPFPPREPTNISLAAVGYGWYAESYRRARELTPADHLRNALRVQTGLTDFAQGNLFDDELPALSRNGGSWTASWRDRTWDRDQLQQQIVFYRSALNTVDPLFFQIENLGRRYGRFMQNPDSTGEFLRDLLEEMLEANAEITRKVSDGEDGAEFAVEASQYVRKGRGEGGALRFDLQGIHALADDQIRESFGGIRHYELGVTRALARIEAEEFLIELAFAAPVIILAVVCPPFGAAGIAVGAVGTLGIGIADAAYQYSEAQEKEEIYQSLENPEQVLARYEVELAYTFAYVSAAFIIFDVVPGVRGARVLFRGARTSLRRVAQEAAERGIRQASRDAISSAAASILRNTAEDAMAIAARAAIFQIGTEVTMRQILPPLIRPVVTSIVRDTIQERGTTLDLPSDTTADRTDSDDASSMEPPSSGADQPDDTDDHPREDSR